MFQRFHAMREEREGGFTLIELLVVILIIAILAAIAIPVFLQQRKKGWVAQAESTLKNAATAQESWATGDGDGNYTTSEANLKLEGFRYADSEIVFTIVEATAGTSYCMEADSSQDLSIDLRYDSDFGAPEEGECP
jgi:type IV pilus assembly protein PilA